MASVNKKGYKMVGLKKAAGETKKLRGGCHGECCEIFYDTKTGEVWTVWQVSLGQNTWTEYHDKNIVKLRNVVTPQTMQGLADMIIDKMQGVGEPATWAE